MVREYIYEVSKILHFLHCMFPYTTNHLDGGIFSGLKKLIKQNQGLAKKRKINLIDEFLSNYN